MLGIWPMTQYSIPLAFTCLLTSNQFGCNNMSEFDQILADRFVLNLKKGGIHPGIHPGFETQWRRHQKSKTGVSVAPNVLQKFLKKTWKREKSQGAIFLIDILLLVVTLRAFNVDFSILGFRSCVPLVADRSNTLNSDWQEPSRLRLTGVSDLAAMATLQEFLHCISMELVLFCLFAVFNLSLLYQYLWISCHKVPKMWNSFTNSGKSDLLTPTLFQSSQLVHSKEC